MLILLCCDLFPLCCANIFGVVACFHCVVLILCLSCGSVVLWFVSVVLRLDDV